MPMEGWVMGRHLLVGRTTLCKPDETCTRHNVPHLKEEDGN